MINELHLVLFFLKISAKYNLLHPIHNILLQYNIKSYSECIGYVQTITMYFGLFETAKELLFSMIILLVIEYRSNLKKNKCILERSNALLQYNGHLFQYLDKKLSCYNKTIIYKWFFLFIKGGIS